MGRSLRNTGRADAGEPHPWWDDVAGNARAHGALPYVVEGFTEITDAVRRGHAVLVRREQAEVADGVTVFESGSTPMSGAFSTVSERASAAPPIVAILRFDVGPTRERQLLTQQLNRGRTLPGNKVPEPLLRAMYGQGGGIQSNRRAN